jgi:Fis family transcriptional regulator, factor for inversion stimulation protein
MIDMDVTNTANEGNTTQEVTPQTQPTLHDCVELAMKNYFSHLDGQPVTDVYNMVLSEVEAALFESVLNYTRGNQTMAADVLSINRGTLRKKLKQYRLI